MKEFERGTTEQRSIADMKRDVWNVKVKKNE